MPLRIWMPSCAAGPLNTAAWPSRILSGVTPCENAGCETSAATISKSFFISDPYSEKVRVLGELREVELAPHPALGVDVLRPNPGRQLGLLALELRRVAQAERPIDEQRGAEPEALAEEQQPRLVAMHHGPLLQERREVHHAVE